MICSSKSVIFICLTVIVGLVAALAEAIPQGLPTTDAQAAARPRPICAKVECGEGEFCEMRGVPCLVAPCPSFPVCIRARPILVDEEPPVALAHAAEEYAGLAGL